MCGAEPAPVAETARVRSNVRAHRDQAFAVWRCGACRSIHAADEVDLDHYYRDYPFQRAQPSRVLRHFHGRLGQRLRRAGAAADARVLDYGCGSGLLVDELRRRGADAHGYDRYTPGFADEAALARTYDVVLAQDVIEHVAAPRALLATLEGLGRPGGLIAIGTPDAAALDLGEPERFVHSLHQPYHRHILSGAALRAAAAARGWRLVRWYHTTYASSWVPTLNQPYLQRYLRAVDDTLDVAFDPPQVRLAMFAPGALLDAAIGHWRSPPTDVMGVFQLQPSEIASVT